MLETVRQAPEAVGSNVRGQTVTPWFYLLPTLDIRRAAVVGQADDRLLQELTRRGIEPIALPSPRPLPTVVRTGLVGTVDVQLVVVGDLDEELPLHAILEERECPAVPVVLQGAAAARTGPAAAYDLRAGAVGRMPEPADVDLRGPVVALRCDIPEIGDRRPLRSAYTAAARLLRRAAPTLFPATDRTQPRLVAPTAARPGEFVPTTTLVMAATTGGCRVPAYIRTVAAEHGIDLDGYGWRFAPPRGFPSQKLLFVLSPPPGSDRPAYVVKLPQEPAYNHRIVNEHRTLASLQEMGIAAVPRPAFLGSSGGLLLVGQGHLEGRSFRREWSGDLRHALPARTVAWLSELGRSSARPAATGELRSSLEDLVSTYVRLYQPDRQVAAALEASVEALAACGVPTVLQHGDLGNWNMLAADDGIVVLDWESAEPRGMPLWDLFYFAQTLGSLAAQRRGVRYRPTVFSRQLLQDSDLSRWLWPAAGAYCDAVGFDSDAVAPAFPLCFVYHAVKEARRLTPGPGMAAGRYQQLVEVIVTAQSGAARAVVH